MNRKYQNTSFDFSRNKPSLALPNKTLLQSFLSRITAQVKSNPGPQKMPKLRSDQAKSNTQYPRPSPSQVHKLAQAQYRSNPRSGPRPKNDCSSSTRLWKRRDCSPSARPFSFSGQSTSIPTANNDYEHGSRQRTPEIL
ncbi:hypothetical protein Droror1_Dr00016434 [Drosera rotundifolia]